MTEKKTQLKILCIHGYRQNSQLFREKTGAFRKLIKKHAELVFISAPNVVPSFEENSVDNVLDERGWWFSHQDDYYNARDVTDCIKGYEESIQVIKEAFREQGPFDGLIGFSQGASMVSLLCGFKEQDTDSDIDFDFAILVAGYKSRSTCHDHLYNTVFSCQSLHVFGETDKVIEQDMSKDLLQYFKEPIIVQHAGGHFIPAGPHKKTYQEFLDHMTKRKVERLQGQ